MRDTRWRISIKYLGVLFLFLPMVFIKSIGLGSSSYAALAIAAISLLGSSLALRSIRVSKREKQLWILLLTLGIILFFTSGKYFLFLSIYSLFLLTRLDSTRLQRDLFYVCIVALFVLIFINWNTYSNELRFVDGEWTSVIKRSNVIFVTFFMLFNLYIMKEKTRKIVILLFIMAGIALFKFTYSRSGFVCLMVEVLLLFLYKIRLIHNSKVIRRVVCFSPFIIFIGVVLINYLYSSIPFLQQVDLLLQHRLYLGNKILSMYPLTFFGQNVIISTAADNYIAMDNTYLNLFINYGILITLCWLVLNVFTFKYLYKTKNYTGIVVLLGYTVYGLTESFVLVSFLNPAFFYYGRYLTEQFSNKK